MTEEKWGIKIYKGEIFKFIIIFMIGIIVIPIVGIWLIPTDAGMFFSIFLLFIVNPILFITGGILAGKNIKKYYYIPMICTIIFFVSYMLIFHMKEAIYSIVYFVLGYIAMGISTFYKKK